MTSHADMLKGLLAKKKGTQAHRDASKATRNTMIELGKQLRQSQSSNAPTNAIMKSAQRGG